MTYGSFIITTSQVHNNAPNTFTKLLYLILVLALCYQRVIGTDTLEFPGQVCITRKGVRIKHDLSGNAKPLATSNSH
jgi:hypothetical protein